MDAEEAQPARERYRLDWPGRQRAQLAADTPVGKSLRIVREDSVALERTRNLFVEGDNLDALKLLLPSLGSKVRLVYIDPPYNTGSDLVYHDDFRVDLASFAERTDLDGEGGRLALNPETSGRFHSDWLNMMFPRLVLARSFLREDGVILVSIDDHEVTNLRKLLDEIFGETNFVACLIWEKGRKNDAKLFSVGHEYVLVYARSLVHLRSSGTVWREEKPGAREIWRYYLELRARHGDDDRAIERDLEAWYAELPRAHPAKKWRRYRRVDRHGPWRDRDISWPGGGGPRYDVIHPITGRPCRVPEAGWRFASREEMQRQIDLGLVVFREDDGEPPFRKAHLRPIVSEEDDEESEELASQVRGSHFYKQSQAAVRHLRELLGAQIFDNPKDHLELARLFDYVTAGDPEAIVLDFFAGSGSTGHAVMHLNQEDGGRRRFVLVQLAEPLDPRQPAQEAAARWCDGLGKPRTIAEITKERLRRAGDRVRAVRAEVDVGFRALSVGGPVFRDTAVAPVTLAQAAMSTLVDRWAPGVSSEAALFAWMHRAGLDLAAPLERRTIAGNEVWIVDGGAAAACLDDVLAPELAAAMVDARPRRVIVRDSAWSSDAAKLEAVRRFAEATPVIELESL